MECPMEAIHADMTVSVTELKRNFASVLATAQNTPIGGGDTSARLQKYHFYCIKMRKYRFLK